MPEAPVGSREQKTGKMFLGLMSLDFSGTFQMVGSVFEIKQYEHSQSSLSVLVQSSSGGLMVSGIYDWLTFGPIKTS